MISVTLSKPVTVIDQSIATITFREMTGKDLIGLPHALNDPLGFSLALADRLAANVPAGTVLDLNFTDAMACAAAIDAMANPTKPASSSTAISSSPAGGETAPASSA